MERAICLLGVFTCSLVLFVTGCAKPPAEKTGEKTTAGTEEKLSGLAELSPEDRELAIAQKICPVSSEPLGSMGAPYKMTLNGKDVFLCCKGCKADAEKDPDATLAKLEKTPSTAR